MKQNIIMPIVIVFSVFTGVGAFMLLSTQQSSDTLTQSGSNESDETETGAVENEEKNIQNPQDKIDELRKRYAVKGLLLEGENYLSNDQYSLALRKFLEANKENPGDSTILEKIGDIYFTTNKYNLSYKYYNQVKQPFTPVLKKKIFQSFLYNSDLSASGSLESALKTMKDLTFPDEEYFYYNNSLHCIEDFHDCKKIFGTWLEESGTGEVLPELQNIKTAIETYRNFQIDELEFKNAQIMAAYLKNKDFPISIIIGQDILEEKPDYKPVLQMMAQSYFELGNEAKAKTYLEKYMEQDSNNPSVLYMIGVIQYKMREFILSNIFFNKALEKGYEPKVNVRRRLIFNYFELEQTEKMLQELKALVYEENDFKPSDAFISIYYHLTNDRIDDALEITKKAQEKYPDEPNLYGYLGWIQKEKGDLEAAEASIKKGLEHGSNSPLLLLNMGQIYIEKGMSSKSIIYLKKTIRNDKNGEFGLQAESLIDKITKEAESSTGSSMNE